MKKVLWFLSVCCLLVEDPLADEAQRLDTKQVCSPPSFLPPLQVYKPFTALPLDHTTHLVAGRCLKNGALLINGVDANKGELTFSVWAPGDKESKSLLVMAGSSGLPVIMYTSPVAPNVQTGGPGTSNSPVDMCELFAIGESPIPNNSTQVVTEPPKDNDSPQGKFALVAVCSAQALASAVSTSAILSLESDGLTIEEP